MPEEANFACSLDPWSLDILFTAAVDETDLPESNQEAKKVLFSWISNLTVRSLILY